MSISPAKILLATDGSKEAELAARTALDIADSTNSELHVATIARVEYHSGYDIPESGALLKGIYESNKRKAQEMLRGYADRRVANVSMGDGEPI
jgi:nucleotide-binding universal stress UspA family protein